MVSVEHGAIEQSSSCANGAFQTSVAQRANVPSLAFDQHTYNETMQHTYNETMLQ
jgi:hypothetical protein